MTCIRKSMNYPCIMQQRDIWCIPASIENVMKYHRPNLNITQAQIVNLYTQNHSLNTICFNSISQVLRINYGTQWNFDSRQWPVNSSFSNYVENCINNDSPVIISMHLPGRLGAHMYTVLGINQRFFRIHDTGYLPIPIDINRNFILNHLATQRGTLLITPI